MTRIARAAALLLMLSGTRVDRARAERGAAARRRCRARQARSRRRCRRPPRPRRRAAGTRPVVPAGELAEEAPAPRAADLSYGVGRAAALGDGPGLAAEPVHQAERAAVVVGNGHRVLPAQGELRSRRVGSRYQNMSPPDGNWLGKGARTPMTDTDYVQFDGPRAVGRRRLVHLALDVHRLVRHALRRRHRRRHRRRRHPAHQQRSRRSAPRRTPATSAQCHPVGALPNGSGGHRPLAAVAHARARRSEQPAPLRDPNVPPVLPIVNIVVGFDFRLPQVRGWEAKIEGGFYNAFFLGGGVGYTF